jgi:hypothetical protein
MASHMVYDLIQHEPDIQLATGLDQPRFGLDLAGVPALDLSLSWPGRSPAGGTSALVGDC